MDWTQYEQYVQWMDNKSSAVLPMIHVNYLGSQQNKAFQLDVKRKLK